ncbi:MAG TPA: methyl-accepting chemotaxis protein, partial [Stellaceae bacterium]|nr:methyl-accepting chemotaxis protein [Stellaceae bacterium]
MSGLRNLSIRTILGLVVAVMGLLVVALSANSTIDAVHRSVDARRVATFASVSQSLFKVLQSHRLERGNVLAPLMAEAASGEAVDKIVAGNRKMAEEGYDEALRALPLLDLAGLPELTTKLKAIHDTVAALRPRVDAALHQPKSARDPGVLQEWPKQTQIFLDVVASVSDTLEAALKLVDPTVDQLLSVKRAAWVARNYAGAEVLMAGSALAVGQPWTQQQILMSAEYRGRVATAWAVVAEAAARPDMSKTVVEAVGKAETDAFGPTTIRRKPVYDALSTGGKPDITSTDWLAREAATLGFINGVANAAMDEMVAGSNDAVRRAVRGVILFGTLLLAALGLSGAGFLVVRSRVSRPILMLTGTIERLAHQDFSVEIPAKTRDDEIGRMQDALLVLCENGRRHEHAVAARVEEHAAAARRAETVGELCGGFDIQVGTRLAAVEQATRRLLDSSEAMAMAAKQSSSETGMVAASAQEASAGVNTVAAAAEELSSSIAEISRQMSQSTAVANDAMAKA